MPANGSISTPDVGAPTSAFPPDPQTIGPYIACLRIGYGYLIQLCKHFAHKVEVTYSGTHGECRFDRGVATLDADAGGLRMAVKAEGEESLAWGPIGYRIASHPLRRPRLAAAGRGHLTVLVLRLVRYAKC
ncbi:DUF2218 domain-containing protein [Rhizobium sullae]